jgi:hypothetical protein
MARRTDEGNRRRRTVRLGVIGAAALAVVVGVALGAWALTSRSEGHACPAYGCGPSVTVDLSAFAGRGLHDLDVHTCLDTGACGDGKVPLYLEELTADHLGAVRVSLPTAGNRPATIRVTELRVADGLGNVLFDGPVDATATTIDARPVPDDCHPDCWTAAVVFADGVLA